jgi:zinc protease
MPNSDRDRAAVIPFPVVERTLPNGLRVVVVPTEFPKLVTVQIAVSAGSRNEVEPGKSGFAHFFEHMMFRGTDRYPPDKYQAVLTQAGARSNAYTSDDLTNYHATFSRDDLERVLDIEADRFQHLRYPEEDFRTEARAVYGEYNKNSADPLEKLFEVQRDCAFTTHTYKHTTMGFLADIEDMPNQFDYSRVFFDRFYRPEYTTLVIVGDVVPDETVQLVERYWGDWRPGNYVADIPSEPPPRGLIQAHVPWTTPTLPWLTVAFRVPGFSETEPDFAALDLLADLEFGPTSALYQQLVDTEQTVDLLFVSNPYNRDPSLITIGARVKRMNDMPAVRDAILSTLARMRHVSIPAANLEDAKAHGRYLLARRLDSTESIGATLAQFVHYRRTTETISNLFSVIDALSPDDLRDAARRYVTDAGLVITTLSEEPLAAEMSSTPPLASFVDTIDSAPIRLTLLRSALPQLTMRLLFETGSADDPPGREGLAALAASMIADAGSRFMRIDQIRRALFPLAASFEPTVDREMTTFSGMVHSDNWEAFLEIVLSQLLQPGLRDEDFARLREAQRNALIEDLRSNNEEELAKERLQTNIFAGTPYGHTTLGTVAALDAMTLDDVRQFIRQRYTRDALRLGLIGDVPDEMIAALQTGLATLPAGAPRSARPAITGRAPQGIEVEIIHKDTRATAISFGFPISVTRAHPDFAALSLARTWLGEHRSSLGRLFQRIREVRGFNYGNYAYIEAFPRGMSQFLPTPNVARRAQLFEIWIRPVVPAHAHMALRIAIHELDALIQNGLSDEDFASTREYLLKSMYLQTATPVDRLGYALDSEWYGIPEFTEYMNDRVSRLTPDDVRSAVRRHLSATNLSVVMVTKDAEALRDALVSDDVSTASYDTQPPKELLDEDRLIGARPLRIAPEKVRITPVEDVFQS